MANVRRKPVPVKFNYPVNAISHNGQVLKNIHHGDIEVSAFIYPNDSIDVVSLKWEGAEIKYLVENVEEMKPFLSMICAACMNHIANMDDFNVWKLEEYGNVLEKTMLVGCTRYDRWCEYRKVTQLVNV